MIDLRRISGLGVALLVGIGCASSPEVGVSFDPLTRFPAESTFMWDDAATKLPADDRIAQLNLDPLIRRVVASEMGERGYRQVGDNPGYLLSHQLGVNTWHGQQGSLSVASWSLQMVEVASGRRVWVGFVRSEVHIASSEVEREARFRETVNRLLKDFPPGGDR